MAGRESRIKADGHLNFNRGNISWRLTRASGIAGEKIECSIVEKMRQSLFVPREEGTKWTAYPEFHQNGLTSSGFLRVTITTYLRGGAKEWVETSTKKIGALLPEIVGRIMAGGPILIEWEHERNEEARMPRDMPLVVARHSANCGSCKPDSNVQTPFHGSPGSR